MTTIKLQIGKTMNNDFIYVTDVYKKYASKTDVFAMMTSYAMQFRTHCITTKASGLNKYHFMNWINKYTEFRASLDFPTTGRVDL
jgi:hypothetical protein